MKKRSLLFSFLFSAYSLFAVQENSAVLSYIQTYNKIAVEQMIAFHIPASITLAQGILESGAGTSELAKESNNHFGIKCHKDWDGDKVYYDDDAQDECFRKYQNVEESYEDHSQFLVNGKRYASLFELKITDYKGWAKGLKSAGYATNPQYADLLIDLIENYQLYEYDQMSLAEVKKHHKPNNTSQQNDAEENKETKNKKSKTEKTYFSWRGYQQSVVFFNRIPSVKVAEGDSPKSLSEEHHIKLSLVLKYNDLQESDTLQPGSNFYLQPKRKKGAVKYHEVKVNETMWSISRDEGVLLSELYQKNKMQKGQEPAVGEKIYLRKTRKTPPLFQSSIQNKNKQLQQQSTLDKSKPSKEKSIEPTEEEKRFDEKMIFDEEDSSSIELNTNIETDTVSISKNKAEAEEPKPLYHTVQPKETLYALSKKYVVTVENIKHWNNLSSNELSIGQKLIVGYQ